MNSKATYFDVNAFEAQWQTSDVKEKALLVKKARYLKPSIGIIPSLTGYFSNHSQIHDYAAATLEFLLKKIGIFLSDKKNQAAFKEGMRESALVSARIYSRISQKIPSRKRQYFFNILVEMGGNGPVFAFKALYSGFMDLDAMEGLATTLSEAGRLSLTDQYIQARPSVRLRFGPVFKTLLKSIKSRAVVVDFYAALFDSCRDADPFLNHIRPALRDPAAIREMEMTSKDSDKRTLGLKALSMQLNRIPHKILLPYLSSEETAEVRITVSKIIENASMGTYSDLYDPLFELFVRSQGEETLYAFKALVATGREPVYRLAEKVRELHPSMIPVIKEDIASLSRTAFYFIQDIALNREHYTGGILQEINLACIFGMIKKRPERVEPLFADWASRGRQKKENLEFVDRIKQLLLDEKRDIESEFKAHISRISREKKSLQTVQRLPKLLKKDPLEEKLKYLKKNIATGSMDFQGYTLSNKALSGRVFRASPLFFNRCRIENCDLSDAVFSFGFFKSAVLHNVDMRNASFDTVSFDHAVFINVNAEGAVFRNCSFQAASFYRTSFNKARIKDAVFIDAVISKSSFDYTDLSGSCFAYSRLSRVSFSTAMTNQVDFSGARARFSRFPHSSRQASKTEDIDYNARNFQLTFEEMPEMDEAARSEINMMIFCEFTHYGEMKFLKQNTLSLLTAYDIFKPRQADLFGMIPVLIHENLNVPMAGSFPEQTPCGIADYVPSPEARSVCAAYTNDENLVIQRNPDPDILGLFTIGSIGSIAQTSESDIDYWVCIQESALNRSRIALLEKKLLMLEKMAMDEFQIQITFFIVDITKVRENNFGDSSIESSGSAQAGLLKEEFYRTFVYLAGKIPLWAVLPTAVSLEYYQTISSRISTDDPLDRYVDLGDIHDISPGEYFGASIWQMFKWLKSPFKSVIKMALLDIYIFKSDRDLLLCNQYKNEWMNTGASLKTAQNDSYYFLMKHLVAFYEKIEDAHSVNLLLTCFFLKLGISKKEQVENTAFGLRKILLLKCMDIWGWDIKRVFEVGSFRVWPYSSIVRLSNALEIYILQKYKQVAKSFENRPDEISMISPEDRKVLEHKVRIEFSDQPMKVRKILLVSRGDRHFHGLRLKHMNTSTPNGEWVLFNKRPKAPEKSEETLIRALSIEEIGAWLMVNVLYSEKTVINMTPNPTPVTFNSIHTLYRRMYEFFHPLITSTVAFEDLLQYPEKKAVFVSVNFYALPDEKKLTHYTALYINAWHEVFCTFCYSDQGFISKAHLKRDLMFKLRIRKLPENTVFFLSNKETSFCK